MMGPGYLEQLAAGVPCPCCRAYLFLDHPRSRKEDAIDDRCNSEDPSHNGARSVAGSQFGWVGYNGVRVTYEVKK